MEGENGESISRYQVHAMAPEGETMDRNIREVKAFGGSEMDPDALDRACSGGMAMKET